MPWLELSWQLDSGETGIAMTVSLATTMWGRLEKWHISLETWDFVIHISVWHWLMKNPLVLDVINVKCSHQSLVFS